MSRQPLETRSFSPSALSVTGRHADSARIEGGVRDGDEAGARPLSPWLQPLRIGRLMLPRLRRWAPMLVGGGMLAGFLLGTVVFSTTWVLAAGLQLQQADTNFNAERDLQSYRPPDLNTREVQTLCDQQFIFERLMVLADPGEKMWDFRRRFRIEFARDTGIFRVTFNGARNALNLTTYYTMKERAGVVAENGVAPLVLKVREACPAVKVHLAGHSFGGRLVTAVANALPKGASHRLHSLFLMQAAFSHYGMAQKYDGTSNGLFRSVVSDKKISGPIYITYTAKDKAVGLAYPLASRLGGQVASGLGDENDTYGGMGRNGAQKTPEVTPHQLLAVNEQYAFVPGGVYNLDANGLITSHSDICRIEVAHALVSAIAST